MSTLRFAACVAGVAGAGAMTLVAWDAAAAPAPAPVLAPTGAATAGCDLLLQGKNAGSFTLLSAPPGTATTGKAASAGERHAPIVLEHPVSADPALRAWVGGSVKAHMQDVRLECRKAGQGGVVYTLHNAFVSQASMITGRRPIERLTIVYESIQDHPLPT